MAARLVFRVGRNWEWGTVTNQSSKVRSEDHNQGLYVFSSPLYRPPTQNITKKKILRSSSREKGTNENGPDERFWTKSTNRGGGTVQVPPGRRDYRTEQNGGPTGGGNPNWILPERKRGKNFFHLSTTSEKGAKKNGLNFTLNGTRA